MVIYVTGCCEMRNIMVPDVLLATILGESANRNACPFQKRE